MDDGNLYFDVETIQRASRTDGDEQELVSMIDEAFEMIGRRLKLERNPTTE